MVKVKAYLLLELKSSIETTNPFSLHAELLRYIYEYDNVFIVQARVHIMLRATEVN